MVDVAHQIQALRSALILLPIAALLGAALGYVRPVRRSLVPRSSHVIQTQVLLALVGAMIILVVAESLPRAFAILGVAGLVRYRAPISDPKDAGVLLVALAVGLLTGGGMLMMAAFSSALVILVLWLLESLEPADRTQFDLTVEVKDAIKARPRVEEALHGKGVKYELWGSSANELRYEVSVPINKKLRKLTKAITNIDSKSDVVVDWRLKKPKTIQT